MKRPARFVLPVVGVATILSLGLLAPAVSAQSNVGYPQLLPLPHPIGDVGTPQHAAASISALARTATSSTSTPSAGGTWTPLTNQPSFLADGASNPVLMTDGSVLIQDAGFPDWWKLTPDSHGSYVNGTWSQIASLPSTYSPLYHSSAVLPDGRLIIEGGEYLLNADQTELVPSWTNQGSIYDPTTNTWTPVAPPSNFGGFGPFPQTIGDAQSVVLPNGTYMQADCCTEDQALLNAKTLTWTPTGSGKFDINDEEGWNLLPNGKVLTADAYVFAYDPNGTNSELYDPSTGTWSSAGSTQAQLWDSAAACGGEPVSTAEVGPAVLRPDGTVFATGANSCGAGHTSIYNSYTKTWTAGPDFPGSLNIADGPAALEPNGRVLMMASPGFGNTPSTFLEWDGKSLTPIAGPPNAPTDSSFFGNMLVLPTGQILLTDFSNDVEIFTPNDRTAPLLSHPLVTSTPLLLGKGQTYSIGGFGFNGVSQGAAYGDDAQAATNYPLVRITNLKSGDVFYARTHDPSSMAVASHSFVSAKFDVSASQATGPSLLQVVANGVGSPPVPVYVK
jgi:Kelch motif